MVAGGLFGICVWFVRLYEWWWGLALRPLGMSLRPEALSRVSFWVAFCRRSFELTNGGCQCWGSKAEGLVNSNESEMKVMNTLMGHVVSDTRILASQ
jgi:hypothetical protein